MTLVEIADTWGEEANAANDCIVEILESYMEVLNIFEATMKRDTIPPKIKQMALTLCKQRKEQWKPILETAKKYTTTINKRNNNDKTIRNNI